MSEHAGHVDVERLGREESPETRARVRATTEKKIANRARFFHQRLHDAASLRLKAADLRQHVIDHLDYYVRQADEQLRANGVQVHFAEDAAQANAIIARLCQEAGARLIAKSKSMVTEEIQLNKHLEGLGIKIVETDLGEYIIQLDNDHPSHIITPIIHKDRFQVGKIFEREGLGEYSDDPETLTMRARHKLRAVFEQADVGITGANFVVAESGRMVMLSNEGNLRYSATAPRVHIAITGIEKVVARDADLAVLLKLLARTATGQDMTVYTQFLSGPRREGDADGPDAVHLIFLDNGRTRLVGGRYREMLRCIRCGACLNVCPVYRSVTGHSYGSVYPGPMGAVYSPLLGGEATRQKFSYLPKASSLCAACEEICPVAIPIPKMLLALREEMKGNAPAPAATPPFGPWATLASHPALWRGALTLGRAVGWGPVRIAPIDAFKGWLTHRELPPWPSQTFRAAWKARGERKQGGGE